MRIVPILVIALASPLPAATATQSPPIGLALPIQCRVGVDCEIQNYVDRDPGPGAKDYIAATLLVERSSQKGIVIGAGGAALTKLSASSRRANGTRSKPRSSSR